MKTKKIPMRTCSGCRECKPKTEMIRVVRTPEGEVKIDLKGKVSGRGVYVCRDKECLRCAVKSRAISRALETDISDEMLQMLEAETEAN